MFQSIFKRAEDAIENTVGLLLIRVSVVIPFLIALAFGVAAIYGWLSREYGPEVASLIIAGVFAVIGVGLAIYASSKARQQTVSGTSSTADGGSGSSSADTAGSTGGVGSKPFSDVDRDLLYAALTSAAPVALPIVARLVLRNLPLITAVGAALFIMTRTSGAQGRASADQ